MSTTIWIDPKKSTETMNSNYSKTRRAFQDAVYEANPALKTILREPRLAESCAQYAPSKKRVSIASSFGNSGDYATFEKPGDRQTPDRDPEYTEYTSSQFAPRVPTTRGAGEAVEEFGGTGRTPEKVKSQESLGNFENARRFVQRRSAREFFNARSILRRNSAASDILSEAERMRGLAGLGRDGRHEKTNDFLSLLEKMQSQRLDEQRCEMPEIHLS
ncbi:unnamed protein product, partial [Mesorhabditis belari]|uniref:Uncharacterized protein n=1 Tax=Mesorhabditis belari TaxID=2138241 RepID=A0AAF3EUX6_9BILA